MVQCHSRSPNVDSVEFIRRLAVGNVGTGADCLDLNFPSLFMKIIRNEVEIRRSKDNI